jgi:hypothetical protein
LAVTAGCATAACGLSCQGWGALPFDRSAPHPTTQGIQVRRAWIPALSAGRRQRASAAIDRARYLVASQQADGGWAPVWFGNEHVEREDDLTYGTARVLAALDADLARATLPGPSGPGIARQNWTDSAFGTGGPITGTETVRPGVEGRYFESEIQADGPDGPFTARATTIFTADRKMVSRYQSDSRGFAYLETGTIGGDLGGYFTIYSESAPFTFKGRTIRLRTTRQLLSPLHYRVRVQASIDDGPPTSLGNPWWRRNGR